MSSIAVALTLLLLAIVIALIGSPLRHGGALAEDGSEAGEEGRPSANDASEVGATAPANPWADDVKASSERAALLVEREDKYREIRDAELDYRTGKLSQADYEAIDGELRAEAIEILDRLEALERP